MTDDYQLEEAILSVFLHDFETINTVTVLPKWFVFRVHRQIVTVLQETAGRVDGLMDLYARVQSVLHEDSFTYQWLLTVEERYVTSANLPYLVTELHRTHLRRTLAEVKAEHDKFPTRELEETMLAILTTMEKIGAPRDEGDLTETLDSFEDALEHEVSQGVLTFGRLDMALGGGIRGGMLVTIGARPSVGKSAFAVNLIQKALRRQSDMRVDLFSLEMSKAEVLARFIALKTGLSSDKLRHLSQMSDTDKATVREAMAYYQAHDLKVYDRIADLHRIMSVMKERAAGMEEGHYLAVIDYLGLIRVADTRRERRLQIEEITRELKVLANEYQVPIILLSQLSRAVEQRQDKSPILSDLRESGSIEQDSNVVGFLMNLETEVNHERYQRVAFQIKKNREGALYDLHFKFYQAKMRFEEDFT